jgi:methyltransferase
MTLSILILAAVTLERLFELLLAERNTRRLLARGAVESGAEHYPVMVGLHAAWLAGLWWWAWDKPADLGWLVAYLVLQVARIWALASLGARWTTRIIVLPGEPLVRRGPYRFFAHPNYAVVIGEVAVLPLVFHMTAYALVFSLLNASILWVRIEAETRALRPVEEEDRPGVRRGRSGLPSDRSRGTRS